MALWEQFTVIKNDIYFQSCDVRAVNQLYLDLAPLFIQVSISGESVNETKKVHLWKKQKSRQ